MNRGWMPGLAELRAYQGAWLPSDLLAGLSVAAIQVPTAVAYATLAGFRPEIGLYASVLPLVAYALFGIVASADRRTGLGDVRDGGGDAAAAGRSATRRGMWTIRSSWRCWSACSRSPAASCGSDSSPISWRGRF